MSDNIKVYLNISD